MKIDCLTDDVRAIIKRVKLFERQRVFLVVIEAYSVQ